MCVEGGGWAGRSVCFCVSARDRHRQIPIVRREKVEGRNFLRPVIYDSHVTTREGATD